MSGIGISLKRLTEAPKLEALVTAAQLKEAISNLKPQALQASLFSAISRGRFLAAW